MENRLVKSWNHVVCCCNWCEQILQRAEEQSGGSCDPGSEALRHEGPEKGCAISCGVQLHLRYPEVTLSAFEIPR